MDFKVKECKMFIDMASNFIVQLIIKKYTTFEFWCNITEKYSL